MTKKKGCLNRKNLQHYKLLRHTGHWERSRKKKDPVIALLNWVSALLDPRVYRERLCMIYFRPIFPT